METILSSWQEGLDSRRSNLTTSPHALQVAQNVHINQGAEVEKRRAFVNFGAQETTAFGIEVTSAGLVTFGSAATPALPVAVSYVQLQHPSDVTQTMTAILCSCSFGGKSWAVARFSNGDVFFYYNGLVLPASTNGLVLTGAASNLAVATQFYNFLNTAYFTALGFQAAAPVLNGTSYYVDVFSTPGVSFSLVQAVLASAAGTIGTLLISTSSQGTAFTQANFAFSVYMGGTGTIASILVSTDNGATFGVSLLGVAIPWATGDTTGYATALNISATVSSSLTSLPITAQANNNQVTLLAASSLGATPNGYPVKLATTGDFCLDDMVLDFSAVSTFSSTSMLVGSLATVFNGQTYNGGGTFTQSTPAGTYFWHKGLNDVSMAVAGGSTFFADNFFTIAVTTNVTFTGLASAPVTAQMTKMLEILGGLTTATTADLFVIALAAKIRTFCIANALTYTACASTANTKQLVVSRSLIVSTNQFLPVLASDVTGVAGIVSPVISSLPKVQLSYIMYTVSTGIINVSLTGGASPYEVSYINNTPTITQVTLSMPQGNPSPVTGSFLINLSVAQAFQGVYTQQFILTTKDSVGSSTQSIITVVFTTVGAPNGTVTNVTVTFS